MGQDVKLAITADASQAVAEVKKVDAALGGTAAAGEAAGKKVGTSLHDIETGAGKAGQASAKLRGFLSLLSPEAAALAGVVNDAADAVEVFAASEQAAAVASAALNPVVLGAVAVFGALTYVLYDSWKANNDHEAATRANAAAIRDAAAAADSARDSISGLGLDWQLATGQISAAVAEQTRLNSQVDKSYEASLNAANQNVGAIKQQIDSVTALRDATLRGSSGWNKYNDQLSDLTPQLHTAEKAYASLQAEVDTTKGKVDDIVAAHVREKQTADDARAATEAKAAASRAEAAALRAAAEAEAKAAKAREQAQATAEAYRAALASLEAAGRSASESNLTGVEKERAARRAALAELQADHQAAIEAGLGTDGALEEADRAYAASREQIVAASEDRIAAIRAKSLEDANAKRAADLAATRAAEAAKFQAVASTLTQAYGVASQLFDLGTGYQTDVLRAMESDLSENEENLTAVQKEELQKRIDAQRSAAARSFAIAKAAKVAEAIASTALAVINAIAQSPPPSPFGLIGAGIAAAAGAVSIAQISAQEPSFHVGTSEVRRYSAQAPDEVRATLLEGEGVLSRRAVAEAGGRTALEDRNAGRRSQVDTPRALPIQYRHQVFNEFIRDNLKLGGPLPTAITGTTRVGHRERSYTNG